MISMEMIGRKCQGDGCMARATRRVFRDEALVGEYCTGCSNQKMNELARAELAKQKEAAK